MKAREKVDGRERGEEEGRGRASARQTALSTVGSLLHKHSLDTDNNAFTS